MTFITLKEAASITGYTVGTLHNYVSRGVFPTARQRIGSADLFSRADVRAFIRTHNARPNARKSARGV